MRIFFFSTFQAMARGPSLPVALNMQLGSQRSEILFQSHSLKSCASEGPPEFNMDQ